MNQGSDHWSFEKAGLPAARVGGTPYAAYHSAADVPAVVQITQLNRVGRLMWAWLNGRTVGRSRATSDAVSDGPADRTPAAGRSWLR